MARGPMWLVVSAAAMSSRSDHEYRRLYYAGKEVPVRPEVRTEIRNHPTAMRGLANAPTNDVLLTNPIRQELGSDLTS